MTSVLFDRIGELFTNAPEGPVVHAGAALAVADGRVAWVGPAESAPACDDRIDCGGAAVVPGFVDSHAHLMFAGDRAAEFAARMAGQPYAAGGIRTTVAATRAASDTTLLENARRLVAELQRGGVTTFEVKTGYGLTTTDEARGAALAARITQEVTFLGAHVVPEEYAADRDGYLEMVTGAMLEACADDARWIDVFCDRGAFDGDEARHVLAAGAAHGLGGRVHANQLQHGPGVQVAVAAGAASADHCTYLDDEDVAALAATSATPTPTVATLLPGAEFSTRSPYPDARRLLDAGVQVALATDCNPGTSYTTSMSFCIALAVREMGMTVAEAVRAATLGGATALRRDDVGRLVPGARADVILLDAPSHVHLAYRPGVALVDRVWRAGEELTHG